jgi:hypothetical protein
MSFINVALIAIAGVLALIFHNSTKVVDKSNDETIAQTKDLQIKIDANNDSLGREQIIVTEIQKKAQDEKAQQVTIDDDAKFFNDRKS